jgi:hypothetical protein
VSGSQYYVSTDDAGVERFGDTSIQWTVPTAGEPSVALTRPDGQLIVLRTAPALLDALDEVIWVAEPTAEVASGPSVGTVTTTAARLSHRTPWDPPSAARFALECAEHAIGVAAAEIELPNGRRIAEVFADAHAFLDSATDEGAHLGLLARLATIRRLSRERTLVANLTYGLTIEDIDAELDLTLDPSWASAASIADSLFAALEALRHLALPRYVAAREDAAAEKDRHEEPVAPTFFETPWGPIAFGGEHESPYLPAALAAREAAFHARAAVRDRSGGSAEDAERTWQAELLLSTIG